MRKVLALLLVLTALAMGATWTLDQATGTTIDARPFLTNAYCARWNPAINRIAFMQPDAHGYYQISTIRPDGSDRRELTAGCPGLPQKHNGTPYWHPSGRYIVLAAQKPEWKGGRLFGFPDYGALPGFGCHNDLWIVTADGSRCWRLTDDPNIRNEGCLIPIFSPDGRQLAWSFRGPDAHYTIKVADFVETPEPHLSNIREYRPGGGQYFEPGSFSSDSRSIAYTSDQDTHDFWSSQIYRLDLGDGRSTRLTDGKDYNEHPSVVKTPTGDWVVYMSTRGVKRVRGHLRLGTDWWAVRLDGSVRKRLTYMNTPGSPEYTGTALVAGTIAISPSGDYFLGDVQDSLTRQTGLIRVVHLTR